MHVGYTGTTTVSGVGVSMTVATSLLVNGGTLYITNGGTVTAPPGSSGTMIGSVATGNGTITITGSGSQLIQTISGTTRLRMGNTTGGVGNLNILNGASVSTGNIYAAYLAGTTANITVDGVGTVWNSDTAGSLGYIGRAGNATLTISNGAVVNTAADPWQISGLAGSVSSVTVTGTGSQLNLTNSNFRVAYAGTGTLTVSDGAVVTFPESSGMVTVADQSGSIGTLTIGAGYTTDVVQVASIVAGLGTASFPPMSTTTITGTAVSGTSIAWDWADESGATGYKVYRSSDNALLTTISSATSDWTQDSLSVNTSYSVYYRGTNANGEGAASANATSVYTLADTPTNLSVSLNSNSITLSVDSFPNDTSGQSGYYFSRSDGNSGWIQTNSWTDSGLSCGNQYTYSVKYRNGDGVETSEISTTKSTNGCPSSGSTAQSRVRNLLSMGNHTQAQQVADQYNVVIPLGAIPPTVQLPNISNGATYNFGITTLKKGSQGEEVKELQRFLNTKLNLNLTIDGKFGPKTKSVVILFQKANNLIPDGIVGPKTKGEMSAM